MSEGEESEEDERRRGRRGQCNEGASLLKEGVAAL